MLHYKLLRTPKGTCVSSFSKLFGLMGDFPRIHSTPSPKYFTKPALDDDRLNLLYEAYNDIYRQYLYPDDNSNLSPNIRKKI